jgi:hypothetical protein
MNVGQIMKIAREWVDSDGSKTPGFGGAYLYGGISMVPETAEFASYRDVDLRILLEGQDTSGMHGRILPYRGVLLELTFGDLARATSPEFALSRIGAYQLAAGRILSDPTGLLRGAHETMKREYPRRKWVVARCGFARQRALDSIEGMDQAPPCRWIEHLTWPTSYLCAMIAMACLHPPTIRRAMALIRDLLQEWNRLDLHEEWLQVLGCAQMDRRQVESYLQESVVAFARAVAVGKTRTRYTGMMHTEMIEEGLHREAMFWILANCFASHLTIQNDGSEEDKGHFQNKADLLRSAIGVGTAGNWQARVRRTRELAEEVFAVTHDIIQRNPEIVD